MPSLEDHAQVAENAIGEHEAARNTFADKTREEMRLLKEKPLVKHAAILRLMTQVNPTSPMGKQHSATSADELAESDQEYATLLSDLRNVVHLKLRAEGEATSARLRAELYIALVKSGAGVI